MSEDIFNNIISVNNLFLAFKEFKKGKSKKPGVRLFESDLRNNILKINNLLMSKKWIPDPYISFYVKDPKLRHIHKASVRDRVLNQAVFRILYRIFDKSFIFDSYSSRINKGTHGAVFRLSDFIRKESNNYKLNVFALKCDIRKFFDNISHDILLDLIENKITGKDALWLIACIVKSFEKYPGKGIPLGNVTSQLFANIYLNELDQFIKHVLKVKYYIRYCDDFVILSKDEDYLKNIIEKIGCFLNNNLELGLHSNKIIIKRVNRGIDFLGYVAFYHHRTLRTKTKRRMIKKIILRKKQFKSGIINYESFNQTLNSYFGVLKHCKGFKIKKEILKITLDKR